VSSKRSLLNKTLEFGIPTFLSRVLGLVREYLQARIIGVGVMSDAFVAAFKLPNSLRKIFAEGALTGAFVPTVVSLLKADGKKSVNDLMTLSFIVFEGILLALCLLVFCCPLFFVKLIAPGFSGEQVTCAVPLLRILISFILFVSSSALLACALQSVNHFFVPAFAPVVLNIFFIAGLFACQWWGLSLTYLCVFIVAGGVAAFVFHLIVYFAFHFSFGSINARTWFNFRALLKKFIPSMLGMSVVELNLFLDSAVSSFLPGGSYTLIYYGYRFMGIPLGVFSVAFSSILLPHFSRVSLYAPKRLNFYLLEAAKFVFWVTIPVAVFMAIFAEKIFLTLIVSNKFPIERVPESAGILIAFLVGLFFFSINKILLNVFYSFHDTKAPTYTSIVATAVNFAGNIVLMQFFGTIGIASATTISAIVQTSLLLYFLRKRYDFVIYWRYFADFFVRFMVQLTIVAGLFAVCYLAVVSALNRYMPVYASLFIDRAGLWLWLMPLVLLSFWVLYVTRKWFGLRMHFLD